MSAITQSKPAAAEHDDNNLEAKALETETDEAIKPVVNGAKQEAPSQLNKAANRSAKSRSTAQEADTNEKEQSLSDSNSSDPAMVQPADLWRQNCSKPHRI